MFILPQATFMYCFDRAFARLADFRTIQRTCTSSLRSPFVSWRPIKPFAPVTSTVLIFMDLPSLLGIGRGSLPCGCGSWQDPNTPTVMPIGRV